MAASLVEQSGLRDDILILIYLKQLLLYLHADLRSGLGILALMLELRLTAVIILKV